MAVTGRLGAALCLLGETGCAPSGSKMVRCYRTEKHEGNRRTRCVATASAGGDRRCASAVNDSRGQAVRDHPRASVVADDQRDSQLPEEASPPPRAIGLVVHSTGSVAYCSAFHRAQLAEGRALVERDREQGADERSRRTGERWESTTSISAADDMSAKGRAVISTLVRATATNGLVCADPDDEADQQEVDDVIGERHDDDLCEHVDGCVPRGAGRSQCPPRSPRSRSTTRCRPP